MITKTRSRMDIWGCFHHWDGRCNVTSAPKSLFMERNRSAPRRSARFNFWLNMMYRIGCRDVRHAIMNITSACWFIVSLITWKPIPATYEWGIITRMWRYFRWRIIYGSRICIPNLVSGEDISGISSSWSPIMCESKYEVVNPNYLFLSLKGGDVEGRSLAKWWEQWSAAPESIMTQKMKRLDLITQTIGKLACTEHTPIKCKAKSQENKGRICDLLNEAGMSHLGEVWDSHTQQAEVCNQL